MLATSLTLLLRGLIGARARWVGCAPDQTLLRIYFANHTSHLDTLVLWTSLPGSLRSITRPVGARDYWGKPGLRSLFARRLFNVLFIDRERKQDGSDPLAPLGEALDQGESLILFPEGTRRAEPLPGPFKSGLFHLAMKYPHVELIPVYLQNLHRSMPKGTWLPVPLTCAVSFGAPLLRLPDEDKAAFLERARAAVVALA